MVLATQNPIEQEGTYPLPEAQMDRFIMKVFIDYPDEETEAKVMRLVRGEDKGSDGGEAIKVEQQRGLRSPQRGVRDPRRRIGRELSRLPHRRHPESRANTATS